MVKVAYPVANSRNDLSPLLLSLKIARHAPCTLCTCQGLHPSQGVTVVSDNRDVYEEADDFDDDEDPQSYLEGCECGHDIVAHNASEAELGRAEWARRGNVGIRIDEILQVHQFLMLTMLVNAHFSGFWSSFRLSIHGRRHEFLTEADDHPWDCFCLFFNPPGTLFTGPHPLRTPYPVFLSWLWRKRILAERTRKSKPSCKEETGKVEFFPIRR
jgi:hypothetical protein